MASSTNNPGLDDLAQSITGSCLCGSIKVILHQDLFSKPNGHICYCESCRKATGTTGFNGLSTTRDKVEIQDPKQMVKTYIDTAPDSGRTVERHFCSNCGSITHFTIPYWKEMCSIPLGIFPKIPQPEYEFFTARKMGWLPKLEGVQSFDLMPTVELVGRKAQ